MRVKTIIDEDIVNYRKISMFIATCFCDFKCCRELGMDICLCQNSPIARAKTIEIDDEKIVDRYLSNEITHAVVIAGLEPFEQFDELISLVGAFRRRTDDDIVIFTGFYENEIADRIERLRKYPNIIVKFGRYVPGQEVHRDRVLGVNLANSEQHAVRIS